MTRTTNKPDNVVRIVEFKSKKSAAAKEEMLRVIDEIRERIEGRMLKILSTRADKMVKPGKL